MRAIVYILTGLMLSHYLFSPARAESSIKLAWLAQRKQVPPALSNLDEPILDSGLPGAHLGLKDNNTTGQFTGHNYVLETYLLGVGDNAIEALQRLISKGIQHVIVNLPARELLPLIQIAQVKGVILYDIGTRDDALRLHDCSPNIIHFKPSRAMRADALAQYLKFKRWDKWFLLVGSTRQDKKYAVAMKRAAYHFNMRIVAEKNWLMNHDVRRTAQSEIPVLTQAKDYDVVVVADEQGLFGEYVAYRSWLPRPVVGTQRLVATSWQRSHEQWGAVQLQNRFRALAGRWMNEDDYAAWLAMRALGEAVTRTSSIDFDTLLGFMQSDEFAIAGFKGRKLSIRPWSRQLRQPVLLASARSMVSVAPLEGYLHPSSELDTLGIDRAESSCQ